MLGIACTKVRPRPAFAPAGFGTASPKRPNLKKERGLGSPLVTAVPDQRLASSMKSLFDPVKDGQVAAALSDLGGRKCDP